MKTSFTAYKPVGLVLGAASGMVVGAVRPVTGAWTD
ncbi:hypothetical protein SSAG_00587 [Streptomyces sp. Mg1]|nr:hypothetical protein SSAG_00587 [Streptomyces sp. Mg1]RPK42265.1 hypothetical protein EES37_18890 [Streptomyces sp. ADI91-18]